MIQSFQSVSCKSAETCTDFTSHVQNLIAMTIDLNSYGHFKHILQHHFLTSGKMIRPYVAFQLGQITEVNQSHLAAWAATCEILHNATLIHDDIQDRDTHRRGQPTTWQQFGDAQAINAGDFLLMSASFPVLNSEIKSQTKNELLMILSKMSCKIVNGQSLELELNNLNIPELIYSKYMNCIALKTAALFSDLALGVNILSEDSLLDSESLNELFSKIGILFQMQDDLIDLYGDKKRDIRGCDIKEGKMSFLVATHYKYHPEDFSLIQPILKKPRLLTTENDIKKVMALFKHKKTLSKCLEQIEELRKEILDLDIVQDNLQLKKLTEHLLEQILSQPLQADE